MKSKKIDPAIAKIMARVANAPVSFSVSLFADGRRTKYTAKVTKTLAAFQAAKKAAIQVELGSTYDGYRGISFVVPEFFTEQNYVCPIGQEPKTLALVVESNDYRGRWEAKVA